MEIKAFATVAPEIAAAERRNAVAYDSFERTASNRPSRG
jgi:hypothetical protein